MRGLPPESWRRVGRRSGWAASCLLHGLPCFAATEGFRQCQQGLLHFGKAQGTQFDNAEKIEEGVVVIAVRLQALVAAANPEQPRIALQGFTQGPMRFTTDVVQQEVGVIDEQEQALPVFVGAAVYGCQAGGCLLSGWQSGDALRRGIERQCCLPPALQGINQAVEHVGPELADRTHRVLFFRKTQRQPGAAQLGIVFHSQGETLHQRGFAHAPCANQQYMLANGIGRRCPECA